MVPFPEFKLFFLLFRIEKFTRVVEPSFPDDSDFKLSSPAKKPKLSVAATPNRASIVLELESSETDEKKPMSKKESVSESFPAPKPKEKSASPSSASSQVPLCS